MFRKSNDDQQSGMEIPAISKLDRGEETMDIHTDSAFDMGELLESLEDSPRIKINSFRLI